MPVLAEAVLLDAENDSLPLAQISKHPALFPFEIQITAQQLRESERMQVLRHGVDADVVALTA